MADEIKVSPEAIELVRLAMESTPPDAVEWRWRQAVMRRIPLVFMVLSERSREALYAQKLIDCKFIRGRVTGIELEESSQRGIVHFEPESGDVKDDETFRTERVDTALGQSQFAQIEGYIGAKGLFLVYVEKVSAALKVRTLQYAVFYGPPPGKERR